MGGYAGRGLDLGVDFAGLVVLQLSLGEHLKVPAEVQVALGEELGVGGVLELLLELLDLLVAEISDVLGNAARAVRVN